MSNSSNIETWIKHELNINLDITSFEKQFSNGYYFGEIFYQYLLNPQFRETFVNRTQTIYRSRNFSQLIPLFKTYIDIDLNKDTIKDLEGARVGVAKKLLLKMRSVLEDKYEDNLKIKNKDFLTDAQRSLYRKVKGRQLNASLQRVELQMVPFEEEMLKQQTRAQEIREEQENNIRDKLQFQRSIRIKNLKHNHDYMKEWEKKHKGLWKRSRLDQKELKSKNVRFETVMTKKVRLAESKRLAASEAEAYGGITAFEDSANRLGIELEHTGFGEEPPAGSKKKKKKEFNPVATMQKINKKIDRLELDRKEKDSRLRRIGLTQRKAEESMKMHTEEIEKLAIYKEKSRVQLLNSSQKIIEAQRMIFIKQNRKEFYEKKDHQLKNTVNTGIKNLKTMSDSKWADRRKQILLKKRMVLLEEREKKYDNNYRICDDILNYMLEMVEVCGKKIGINHDAKGSRAVSANAMNKPDQVLNVELSNMGESQMTKRLREDKLTTGVDNTEYGGLSSVFKEKSDMKSMMKVKEAPRAPEGGELTAE